MKSALQSVMISVSVLAASVAAASAQDAHTAMSPEEIEWSAAPPSLPPGAEAAVLFGDPGQEGPFALRLKLPEGYSIPPHTHPKPEVVTVISGTFRLGMGETADDSAAQAFPAGSFIALPPEMAHYVSAEGETVVQLNSIGPWGLTYINPEDDPRQTQ